MMTVELSEPILAQSHGAGNHTSAVNFRACGVLGREPVGVFIRPNKCNSEEVNTDLFYMFLAHMCRHIIAHATHLVCRTYTSSSALITTFLKPSLSSRGYESNINWDTGEGHPFEYFVYGAACSEVEVDCLTGAYKVSTEGVPAGRTSTPHSPLLSTAEAPGVWPEDSSRYYQRKIDAQQFPWCSDCSHGKQPLFFTSGPFNGLRTEATARGFTVDCEDNWQW